MGRVRLSDLAKKAGVSQATVSRVVNHTGYVAGDVRARVEQAIEETGYVHQARKIPCRGEKMIGIITLHGALNPYFGSMVCALQQQAEQSGYYGIQVSAPVLDNEVLASHAKRLSLIGVCGIVVCSFNAEHLSDEARTVLHRSDIPIVFLERTSGCYGFNRVLVDNELGTFSATQHLIDKGHKHLAYLTLDRDTPVETSRAAGFAKALKNQKTVSSCVIKCKENTPKAAAEATAALYKKDFQISGILAWNDVFASGVLSQVLTMGKLVPGDVEIIGYDNVLAPHLAFPISSVEMPIREIASTAIDIINKSQDAKNQPAPRTVTLEPRLVIR